MYALKYRSPLTKDQSNPKFNMSIIYDFLY